MSVSTSPVMSSSASRILIAGVGNVFYGDDAFGSEVARRLAEQSLPDNVRVIDFGIRGFDLVAALLDPYDVVIIVDALSQGDQPGALRVFDSQRDLTIEPLPPGFHPEWHSLDPATALEMAHSLGGNLGRILLVGCEQSRSVEPAVLQMGMSESVQAAVNDAVGLILSLVTQLNQRAG
jgi:hydrogenase maturation protease